MLKKRIRLIRFSARYGIVMTISCQKPIFPPEGWITEKGNPKLFKQYLKLELRNKCPCESVFCLSEDMRDVIVSMSENLRYVEFARSEDFGDLPEVGIGRGVLSDAPFFCVGFGQKYILNK